jgi:hypothetical protein
VAITSLNVAMEKYLRVAQLHGNLVFLFLAGTLFYSFAGWPDNNKGVPYVLLIHVLTHIVMWKWSQTGRHWARKTSIAIGCAYVALGIIAWPLLLIGIYLLYVVAPKAADFKFTVRQSG